MDQNRRKLLNFAEKLRSEDGNKEVQGGENMPGFKDIIGHKREIEHLEMAISTGKVSHAYIFCGEKALES